MIAVIADDLTGAAELAGIGLQYRLKTEVNTVVDLNTKAELLIVAANTRSLTGEEAKEVSRKVTAQLMRLKPALIFKKIDSVLRGNIISETEGQLEASGLRRGLIIPGNPMHQKTVLNGIYYYQGKPVHESAYAIDPEYPVKSSQVKNMLRAGDDVCLLQAGDKLGESGISVGDIANDYLHWVNQLDNQTMLAGAAGLFEAVLEKLYPQQRRPGVDNAAFGSPRLFVFGSTFHQGKQRPEAGFGKMNWYFLPAAVASESFNADTDGKAFVAEVASSLSLGQNAIVAINPDTIKDVIVDPKVLALNIAGVIKLIHAKTSVTELLIEGGATAAAIIARLGITSMCPEQQLSPGVIRLSVPGNTQLYITMKPGSYEWPAFALA